jgi:hypothetical protein
VSALKKYIYKKKKKKKKKKKERRINHFHSIKVLLGSEKSIIVEAINDEK